MGVEDRSGHNACVRDRIQAMARPPHLERWVPGAPVVDGVVVLGAAADGHLARPVERQLAGLGVSTATALGDDQRAKALVFDASGVRVVDDLAALHQFFTPVLRRLAPCGRVLVLGIPPELAADPVHSVAQRALEGFTRSLAKELRGGATAQLLCSSRPAPNRRWHRRWRSCCHPARRTCPGRWSVSAQPARRFRPGCTTRGARSPAGWCWSLAPPAASARRWLGC